MDSRGESLVVRLLQQRQCKQETSASIEIDETALRPTIDKGQCIETELV
jgi:hypothetical protein